MSRLLKIILSAVLIMTMTGCTGGTEQVQTTSGTKTEADVTEQTEETTAVSETVSETVTEPESVSYIDSLIESMNSEQKAGQILLARYPKESASEMADKYQVGGYTLYADDFKEYSPDAMAKVIKQLQGHFKIPAFMAVDEEGGTVVRVSKYPQYRLIPFSSQIALARGGEEKVRSEAEEKAQLLSSVGLNFNLAPVADMTENHSDYIYDRTFGEDAELTGDYVAMTVEVMNKNNMGSCLKHFPGYGSNLDTHNGISEDSREITAFEENDFIPFKKGIEAGVPSVMVSHNIVKAFDEENPASLSEEVHRVLREDLGFEGVIVTDDMGMEAITSLESEESVYVRAFLAGNDLLCVTDLETAYNDIFAAVNDGTITEERLNESIRRILEMKIELGIISEE
ncbi:MAG: beta-hexosaminidase [Oscillospiraceae bacterium]|nr:beta-hexosaminidase [Oscillospiraceae bacterium]